MSYVTDKIMKSHRVRDYLASKGIHPKNPNGSDTFLYKCPLPNHTDKTPSFIVYDKGDVDDYYCFGCKKSGNIIHLYAALEGVSLKHAIVNLSDGIKIDSEDQMNSIIDEIIKEKVQEPSPDEILEYSFIISDLMYRFLRKTDFDSEEFQISEKLFKKVDEMVRFNMRKELREIEMMLPDYLEKRMIIFQKKKEDAQIENLKEIKAFREIV